MMDVILQFIVAVAATVGFAIIYNAPKKEIIFCGISGAIGWTIYYALIGAGSGVLVATMMGTIALTFYSRVTAIVRKHPATVYLLTGIFALVPGAGIYYTAYYMFSGYTEMFRAKGLETFEVAAAILFGIIFGSVIPTGWLKSSAHKREK